ncbi:MAG: 2-phospho-L-lactate transferase [Gammaproteobacteria bacterium]|nr:2-phospho-L-lactate transferase [Gammaproteobacteria bacterium]
MKALALTGGVGGAKLALGLAQILSQTELTFLANTGDDFDHLGMHIAPDLDTLVYTLAGISNRSAGWGREDETWSFESTLEQLGGETWFKLGDRDLAVHVHRTYLMRQGASLTEVTLLIAQKFGVAHPILPMSDDPVRTVVNTREGLLSFQRYFVEKQCKPTVLSLRYQGADTAELNPELSLDDFSCVIICPSNPYLSIDPMLAIGGLRDFLASTSIPVVAVTPLVKGAALKGPTAKMMRELGLESNAVTVAEHYKEVVSGFVLDQQDEGLLESVRSLGLEATALQTVMSTLDDRIALARQVLDFCDSI